jgi:triphosphoribosyl-dephospho-CoA synthase
MKEMNSNSSEISQKLSSAYKAACLAELEALKPGNVHVFADGHGMTIHDFIKSAELSSAVIAQENLTVGERIYRSIEATRKAVGLNTNLGLILLCAPLIHTYLKNADNSPDINQDFQKHLAHTLNSLTVDDGISVAGAIVLASPAGLGRSGENDVHALPKVTLLEMMRTAQNKDRIAWQYTNNFSDILEFGLTKYALAMSQWQGLTNSRRQNKVWATTAIYLSFMAKELDSHIVRKYGETLAEQVKLEALEMEAVFWAAENPKLVHKQLLHWDASLKARNINPGTSADLTVATLLVKYLK